mmetsp:Transcript_22397/g.33528  ORF Transcript_22397/g.33528 Transcript_22397/m.33528 type:complete len:265 (-) Transcript_22397:334-1128(-)
MQHSPLSLPLSAALAFASAAGSSGSLGLSTLAAPIATGFALAPAILAPVSSPLSALAPVATSHSPGVALSPIALAGPGVEALGASPAATPAVLAPGIPALATPGLHTLATAIRATLATPGICLSSPGRALARRTPHGSIAAGLAPVASLAFALLLGPACATADIGGFELTVASSAVLRIEGDPVACSGHTIQAIPNVEEDVGTLHVNEAPALAGIVRPNNALLTARPLALAFALRSFRDGQGLGGVSGAADDVGGLRLAVSIRL